MISPGRRLGAHPCAGDPARGAAAYHLLMLAGIVCGGWQLGRAALAADRALADGAPDRDFLTAKLATSQFYAQQVMPQASAHAQVISLGRTLMGMQAFYGRPIRRLAHRRASRRSGFPEGPAGSEKSQQRQVFLNVKEGMLGGRPDKQYRPGRTSCSCSPMRKRARPSATK